MAERDVPGDCASGKAESAEIQLGDETGLRSDDVQVRSYAAPMGKTPERRVASRREGLSVTSTVKTPWPSVLESIRGRDERRHPARFLEAS
ncbi:MAG: hypothetical protein V3Q69_09585 [Burkholderia sp.]